MVKGAYFGNECIGFVSNYLRYIKVWNKYLGVNNHSWSVHFTVDGVANGTLKLDIFPVLGVRWRPQGPDAQPRGIPVAGGGEVSGRRPAHSVHHLWDSAGGQQPPGPPHARPAIRLAALPLHTARTPSGLDDRETARLKSIAAQIQRRGAADLGSASGSFGSSIADWTERVCRNKIFSVA